MSRVVDAGQLHRHPSLHDGVDHASVGQPPLVRAGDVVHEQQSAGGLMGQDCRHERGVQTGDPGHDPTFVGEERGRGLDPDVTAVRGGAEQEREVPCLALAQRAGPPAGVGIQRRVHPRGEVGQPARLGPPLPVCRVGAGGRGRAVRRVDEGLRDARAELRQIAHPPPRIPSVGRQQPKDDDVQPVALTHLLDDVGDLGPEPRPRHHGGERAEHGAGGVAQQQGDLPHVSVVGGRGHPADAVTVSGSPDGIRTRATALRGRRARPLHNGALAVSIAFGASAGGERRTRPYP